MLGLERPPKSAIAALVTLALANTALFTHMAMQSEDVHAEPSLVASRATTSASGATPSGAVSTSTQEPAPTSSPAAEPPVVAVYGDGYSAGSSEGGAGERGWPARLAAAIDGELQLHAVSMAGFEALGLTGQDFADIATANPVPEADITIVFGSRNDLGATASAVAEGAAETFDAIRSTAPDTQLVVVGPAWSNAEIPMDLYTLRDAVQEAAATAGATFVDPLADGWFAEPAGHVAADGISPTDAGHKFMASELIPVVQPATATR